MWSGATRRGAAGTRNRRRAAGDRRRGAAGSAGRARVDAGCVQKPLRTLLRRRRGRDVHGGADRPRRARRAEKRQCAARLRRRLATSVTRKELANRRRRRGWTSVGAATGPVQAVFGRRGVSSDRRWRCAKGHRRTSAERGNPSEAHLGRRRGTSEVTSESVRCFSKATSDALSAPMTARALPGRPIALRRRPEVALNKSQTRT
mmetsp:Transcript_21059/g.72785  ORF Transcript_21059/g.72785 Transcript_21059/m.72785 type:complete len:204 (+) Transcript_21059:2006-2617(+)